MTREQFLKGITNFDNHRHLLWEALEMTDGDVIEMGVGYGSTPFLAQYCKDAGRKLYSYENNLDWYEKCHHFHNQIYHITDWDVVAERHLTPSVLFLDHAPGERRKIDLANFALRARVVVVHDSEVAADHGYQMRQHFSKYKYWRDFTSDGAGATILSNFMPV